MKSHLIASALLTLFVLGILPGCAIPSTRQQDEPRTANEPASTSAAPQRITAEDAESIALSHAGVNRADVRYLRTEFDYDDGVPEYEVEFRSDDWEYQFKIHAETGKILYRDRESEK